MGVFGYRLSPKRTKLALAAARANLDIQLNSPLMGPTTKIHRLAESTADKSETHRLLNTGDQVNFLHHVQDSLKSADSGDLRYASF